MADRLVAQAGVVDTAGLEVLERMVDQGDGTWARKVVSTGGSGGTQYTEGVTQATPTGTVLLWKDAGNVLHVPSPANPLPVTGGGGGTQYAEGVTQATPTGTALLWRDASNVLHVPSPATPLPVTGGGGTQYAEGATQATPTATAVLWKDASNVLHVPSVANPLPVTIGALPALLTDAMAPIAVGQIGALGELYNGATNDRAYNNLQLTLAASAARTTTLSIASQLNPNHRGCLVFLNITASPANASAALTLAILAVDPVSGAPMPLFTPTAIAATGVANAVTGLYVAQLYPGLPAQAATTKNGAPASANGLLPRVWTVSITPATADSWTYSVGASLVL